MRDLRRNTTKEKAPTPLRRDIGDNGSGESVVLPIFLHKDQSIDIFAHFQLSWS